MIIFAAIVSVLIAINLLAAFVATRVIAARIDQSFTPGGHFVAIAGGRLHYYDLGPTGALAGPPILLLHGASSNGRDIFNALSPDLAKHHRVIAFDRPGHGWSDRPDGRADASPARQAALIAEGLDHLGIGRMVIVGHSWSGALAACFALDHADHVDGLVLLAGVTYPWSGGVSWYYDLAATPVIGDIFVNTLMTPVASFSFDKALAAAFAPHAEPAGYAEAAAAALLLRPDEFRWNGQDVAALYDFVVTQAPRYPTIRVPTAVVTSDIDNTVSPAIHSRAIAKAIPGAKLTILPGAGHQLSYTDTAAVVAAIEDVAALAQEKP